MHNVVSVSSTRSEERVPVAVRVVHGRQAEGIRVLGEADRVAALGGAAVDLLRRELGVPQRDDRQRDQATFPVARAPLVDHPVVVGLDAEERELLVGALEERLAAEPGQHVREADRRLDVVGVHVGEPFGELPATGADLVEGDRGVVEVGEADGGRQPRERVHEVVVEPEVAPVAVLGALVVREDAADEGELRLVAHDARRTVRVLRREPVRPQVGGLHDVVVGRDDARDVSHGPMLPRPPCGRRRRAGSRTGCRTRPLR